MKIYLHHYKLQVALAQYVSKLSSFSQEFLTNQYDLRTIWVLLFLVTVLMVVW